jgi:enoyl-CoA hydratase
VEGAAVAGGFEIALACDLIVAAENTRFGLPEVQRGLVAAGGGLLRLSRRIARNGPLALAATKRVLAECPDWPSAEAFTRQREITEPVRESADAREGSRAFVEKRTPQWQGR